MAKDIYHEAVRLALEKEGWRITHDHFTFKVGEVAFLIDLGAEKLLVAERENSKIAVEVKSFVRASPLNAFHEALGQYENYLLALEEYDPERVLFLAVPLEVYNTFFQKPFIQKVIRRKNLHIIVYEPTSAKIEIWIS
jgi:XisH protein